MTSNDRKKTALLIQKALKEFPKVLRKKELAYREKEKVLKAFKPLAIDLKKRTARRNKKFQKVTQERVHPWRICPGGQYFRRAHVQHAYTRKSGVSVSGSEHPDECVLNNTGKDQLYSDEIKLIAEKYFEDLQGPPTSDDLGRSNGNKFDALIRGWTKYWNEVLTPSEPLDPNLVKALIASESDFNIDPPHPKRDLLKARGLMQVTNESRKMLSNEIHDMADHFVHVDLEDMTDPNLNIAAGTRWLFRKKQIADAEGNENGWLGAVMKYKNYPSLDEPQMKKFLGFYEKLKR